MARILSVCRRACRGPDPGTAADGGVRHLVPRRAAHGDEARNRQAVGLNPESWIDGRLVHGQDRHVDRGEDKAGTACGRGR